jgi:hypothetical protein
MLRPNISTFRMRFWLLIGTGANEDRLTAREERDNSMTDTTSRASAEAGAAIYSKQLLSVYDLGVIKFSNTIAWGCPAHPYSQKTP